MFQNNNLITVSNQFRMFQNYLLSITEASEHVSKCLRVH
jgi:hypothetical protein